MGETYIYNNWDSNNSIAKTPNNMIKRSTKDLYRCFSKTKRYTNCQEMDFFKMFSITNNEEYANYNHNRLSLHSSKNDYYKKE
jgi:hypothetical protein